MVKKQTTSELYEIYKDMNLNGIKIDIFNNKLIPIIHTVGVYKGNSARLKVLLYLIRLIADNKVKSVKDITFYLEQSLKNRIEILKIINEETKKEEKLKNIISDDVYPYVIEELEKEITDDPYIIKNDDGTVTNLVFDFIEKVSSKTKFLFSSKYPRTIGLNLKATKTFLKESNIELEQLEWFFDKVYTQFIYDGFEHKSIRGFILEAEDYFYNTEKTQLTIKALMIYLKLTNSNNLTPLTVGGALKKNKQVINSILENIGNDLENFEKIVKDFGTKYKSKGLNWTLNTVFNNLFTQYGKYIKTEDNNENSNILENKMSNEFTEYMTEKSITDKDLIKELFSIYNTQGLPKIREVLGD